MTWEQEATARRRAGELQVIGRHLILCFVLTLIVGVTSWTRSTLLHLAARTPLDLLWPPQLTASKWVAEIADSFRFPHPDCSAESDKSPLTRLQFAKFLKNVAQRMRKRGLAISDLKVLDASA
jgi:hypothetical protein